MELHMSLAESIQVVRCVDLSLEPAEAAHFLHQVSQQLSQLTFLAIQISESTGSDMQKLRLAKRQAADSQLAIL